MLVATAYASHTQHRQDIYYIYLSMCKSRQNVPFKCTGESIVRRRGVEGMGEFGNGMREWWVVVSNNRQQNRILSFCNHRQSAENAEQRQQWWQNKKRQQNRNTCSDAIRWGDLESMCTIRDEWKTYYVFLSTRYLLSTINSRSHYLSLLLPTPLPIIPFPECRYHRRQYLFSTLLIFLRNQYSYI